MCTKQYFKNNYLLKYFSDLIQKIQKERQEKQEKEEEEKKEKQRQEAEEMIRKMHENTDVFDERTAVTEQGETKVSSNESTSQVPEVVGETVEVDAEASSNATSTDKTTKTSASTSSSEDIDEEMVEGEEKIGKDGETLQNFVILNLVEKKIVSSIFKKRNIFFKSRFR